jgi:hypothetical protein
MSKRPGDPGYAPGWCIHYRYNHSLAPGQLDTCEAGVDYATFTFKFDVRPCFLTQEGKSKPGAIACDKLRRPTPEEIKAHRKWLAERRELLITGQQPRRRNPAR